MTNQFNITGRLTKDPEVRILGDKKVAQITVATNPFNKKTQFIQMTAWNEKADQLEANFKKGQKIEVTARLKQKVSEQKGVKDYNYEIVVVSFGDTEKKDFNSLQLLGNLTKDPELKYTQTGKAVATFTIAVNGANNTSTFFNVTAWEEKAVEIADNFRKGEKVNALLRIKQNVSERPVPNTTDVVKFYGFDFDVFKVEKLVKDQQQQNAQEEQFPWEGEVIV